MSFFWLGATLAPKDPPQEKIETMLVEIKMRTDLDRKVSGLIILFTCVVIKYSHIFF